MRVMTRSNQNSRVLLGGMKNGGHSAKSSTIPYKVKYSLNYMPQKCHS